MTRQVSVFDQPVNELVRAMEQQPRLVLWFLLGLTPVGVGAVLEQLGTPPWTNHLGQWMAAGGTVTVVCLLALGVLARRRQGHSISLLGWGWVLAALVWVEAPLVEPFAPGLAPRFREAFNLGVVLLWALYAGPAWVRAWRELGPSTPLLNLILATVGSLAVTAAFLAFFVGGWLVYRPPWLWPLLASLPLWVMYYLPLRRRLGGSPLRVPVEEVVEAAVPDSLLPEFERVEAQRLREDSNRIVIWSGIVGLVLLLSGLPLTMASASDVLVWFVAVTGVVTILGGLVWAAVIGERGRRLLRQAQAEAEERRDEPPKRIELD
ncbi:MAG TPA: hypothetical protein VGM19_13055 [Armatimonadota bacterium]|jgi:hypothetical protein